MTPTREQVIGWAKEADLLDARDDESTVPGCYGAGLERFATLAMAAGRDQRDEPVIPVWPIDDRIALKLLMIKQIGQGSTTANSLPHVARIAEEALQLINTRSDETPRWRLLRRGEAIQLTDEGLQDDCVTWLPMAGWEAGMTYEPCVLVPIRRREA